MTLPEFLRAQLDEDQQQAEKLMRRAQDTQLMLNDHPEWLGLPNPGWHDWPDVETLCSQALADIAAKRALLDEHFPWHEAPYICCANCWQYLNWGRREESDGEFLELNRVLWPCDTMRLIAQPYSGRLGWFPDWEVKG